MEKQERYIRRTWGMKQQKPRSASMFHNVPVGNNGNREYYAFFTHFILFFLYNFFCLSSACCWCSVLTNLESAIFGVPKWSGRTAFANVFCFPRPHHFLNIRYSLLHRFGSVLKRTTRFDTHQDYHVNEYTFNLPYNLALLVCDDLSYTRFFSFLLLSIYWVFVHLLCSETLCRQLIRSTLKCFAW